MSDERARLSKTYRDLDGADLLELYRNRADLSPLAVETLRDELKVRGVDPDSLKATVPKASSGAGDDEPGDASDASLAGETDPENAPDDADDGAEPPVPPEVPDELAGEFDPTANIQVCPKCEAHNHADDLRCRSCKATLRPVAEGAADPSTMARPAAGAGRAAPAEPGTVASATFGLMGLSGMVFAIYVYTGDPAARSIALVAGVVGAICLGIAVTLFRNSRPK